MMPVSEPGGLAQFDREMACAAAQLDGALRLMRLRVAQGVSREQALCDMTAWILRDKTPAWAAMLAVAAIWRLTADDDKKQET